MKRIVLLSSVFLLLAGCGEEDAVLTRHTDSSAVDTLYLSAVDTIGVEMGEESLVFAFLVACGYTSEGNIAALDGQKASLQLIDPTGEELMVIGNSGQGPGEYQMALGMAITGNGYVLSDIAGSKIIRYNSDGSFRDEITDFGMMPPSRISGTVGDNYLAQHIILNLEGEDGPQAEMVFALFSDSSEADIVYESYTLDMQGGMLRSNTQLSIAGGINGEAVLAEQSDSIFKLVSFAPDGSEIFRIEEEWDRIPLSEEELAEEELSISMTMSDEGSSIERNRQPTTDEYRTIIEGMGVDSQGRIWVCMGDTGTPYFRVYSPEGDLLNIAIPDGSIDERAEYMISPYGFLAYDSDPDDWPKIYLIEVTP